MNKEDKEHIQEEISNIQDRLDSLKKQLEDEPEETNSTEGSQEINDDEIPVVMIDTANREAEEQQENTSKTN